MSSHNIYFVTRGRDMRYFPNIYYVERKLFLNLTKIIKLKIKK